MPSHQERREPLPKGYQFPTPKDRGEMVVVDKPMWIGGYYINPKLFMDAWKRAGMK